MTRLPPHARPTFYRGVQMRSRLEATVAEWLDAQGLIWKYEGSAYGSEDGQYLPDFQITGLLIEGGSHILYFDVKPPRLEHKQPGLIGRTLNKMERIWASDPAARLMVVGAHDDPYVMAMRWREGADRVLANGSWVRCEECGFIGVEDFYQLGPHVLARTRVMAVPYL